MDKSRGGARRLHPAMKKAIDDECAAVLSALKDKPNGLTLKQIEKAVAKTVGYMTTTYGDRVKSLLGEDKIHRGKRKGTSAHVYIFGPDHGPAKTATPVEPALVADEMISLLFEFEKSMVKRLDRFEEKQDRALRLLCVLCAETGIDTNI